LATLGLAWFGLATLVLASLIGLFMYKLQLTGQNLGRVFIYICGGLAYALRYSKFLIFSLKKVISIYNATADSQLTSKIFVSVSKNLFLNSVDRIKLHSISKNTFF
jgi:hypothetical protein